MQTPKNNLEEVRRRQQTGSASPAVLPQQNAKPSKSKFKPATSVPSGSKLPAFSTPGFGKARSETQPGNAAALKSSSNLVNKREIYDISSESGSSSPIGPIKRTSSDPSLDIPPIQASKRIKASSSAEKENLTTKPSVSHKVKSVITTAPPKRPSTEDEPWMNTELDPEPNPFRRLTRDFPQFKSAPSASSASATAPVRVATKLTTPVAESSDKDDKLMKRSVSDLQKLLVANHEISDFVSDIAFQHQRSEDTPVDMDLVDEIRTMVRNRNASIKRAIALKETGSENASTSIQDRMSLAAQQSGEVEPPPIRYASANSSNPPMVQRSISEEPSTTDVSYPQFTTASSSRVVSEPIEIDDDDDLDDRPQHPASDDYWAEMDDLPIAIDHRVAVVTAAAAATASTTATTASGVTTTKSSQLVVSGQSTTSLDREIMRVLQTVFRLQTFRHNQREAIVSALSGKDVFVLMPTGGGKSLCYQLPAVCRLGNTQAVTLVVSPLISLMKDQVKALEEKGVDVVLWNAETTDARSRLLAVDKPSLVYVTPEKLKESGQAQSTLNRLHERRQLARFVIDEAHCISTWGQDFREAYQGLSSLRERYPTVPIMALTATATKNTIADIRSQLRLNDDYAFFKQSFNRPNLRYVILEKKARGLAEQMMEFIRTTHPNKSGVIYCLSRKNCEDIAGKFGNNGFKAHYYHAGMTSAEKDKTLDDWQKGRIHIIVATIAFGMGIDKPDVRFVLHHCMPKTLDGYYQETGRAGRDGKPADCILYYSFSDYCRLVSMIKSNKNDPPPSPEAIERQCAAARTVVSYCNNVSECRRAQVLAHFDEQFDSKNCGSEYPESKCDNCSSTAPISVEDLTDEANHALNIVEAVPQRITPAKCRDILRGSSKDNKSGPHFGSAQTLSSELVDQMLVTMTMMGVLAVESVEQTNKFNTDYLIIGPGAAEFRSQRLELKIKWRQKPGGAKKPRSRKPKSKGAQQSATDLDPIEAFQEDESYDIEDSGTPSGNSSQTSGVRQTNITLTRAPETTISSAQVARADSEDSASVLYRELRKLRAELTRAEGLPSEEDVLDDVTIQYLSVTCPLDFNAFKNVIITVASDSVSEERARAYADHRYKKYGTRFLNVCREHKSSQRPPDSETLRNRYTYQGAPASNAGSATGRTKFKASK